MKLRTKIKRYLIASLMIIGCFLGGEAIAYETRHNIQEFLGETPEPVLMVVEKTYTDKMYFAVYFSGRTEVCPESGPEDTNGLEYIVEVRYNRVDPDTGPFMIAMLLLKSADGMGIRLVLSIPSSDYEIHYRHFEVNPDDFASGSEQGSGF